MMVINPFTHFFWSLSCYSANEMCGGKRPTVSSMLLCHTQNTKKNHSFNVLFDFVNVIFVMYYPQLLSVRTHEFHANSHKTRLWGCCYFIKELFEIYTNTWLVAIFTLCKAQFGSSHCKRRLFRSQLNRFILNYYPAWRSYELEFWISVKLLDYFFIGPWKIILSREYV